MKNNAIRFHGSDIWHIFHEGHGIDPFKNMRKLILPTDENFADKFINYIDYYHIKSFQRGGS